MKRRLFFLTETFPYGHGEHFIEDELPFLIDSFDEVVIIPLSYGSLGGLRAVDSRVTVMPPVIKDGKIAKYVKGLFNRAPIIPFLRELRFKKALHIRRIRQWLVTSLITRYILSGPLLPYLRQQLTEHDVLYSYWGTGLGMIFPFVKDSKAKKTVRLHGSDLYEYHAPLFLREPLFSSVDSIVLISRHGKEYLADRYPQYADKMVVFPLGTHDGGVSHPGTDGVLRIVSCSYVRAVKRVHLIVDALMLLTDIPVEWTHIGGGPLLHAVQERASRLPAQVKAHFTGTVPGAFIQRFYRESAVDLFVNVSESEGVPVSVMEAVSFGIPVIATDVGGTREIIGDERFLLKKEFTPSELKDKIVAFQKTVRSAELRSMLRTRWEQEYNAEVNHKRFAAFLRGENGEER